MDNGLTTNAGGQPSPQDSGGHDCDRRSGIRITQQKNEEVRKTGMSRIENTFAALREKGQKAFISYTMAGDNNYGQSLEIMKGLPGAGVDIIELGLPFTDPMADGTTIQMAGQRALAGGQTLTLTLKMAREFRESDSTTPIVLMGYYNPIYSMGVDHFLEEATRAGIDGLIVVDLPPEEDDELCLPAQQAGLNFVRLATPTSDDHRLEKVITNSPGFVYYVSMTGITGTATAQNDVVQPEIDRIKQQTTLPVVVGFGIKTPEAAKSFAPIADGVVVGSAIVERIGRGDSTDDVLKFVAELSGAVHS